MSQREARDPLLEGHTGSIAASQEFMTSQTVQEEVNVRAVGENTDIEKTTAMSATAESEETNHSESTTNMRASNLSTSFSSNPGYLSNRWSSGVSSRSTPTSSQVIGGAAAM
jgi:hypothetical protein